MFEKLKPLVPYLRRYWKHLAWRGVAVILYNVIKVLIPVVIGHAIDDMQHGITEPKVLFHPLRLLIIASDISAKAQANFSGARLIRAFAQEEAEIASFETANREYIKRSLYLVRLMAMLWPTLEFVLGLSLMITLLVGGHEVVSHRISVGQFTAFNVYMVQLTWPMIAVGWVVNLFQRGTASVVRIDELLKQQPSIADAPTATAIPVTGDIEFRNLTFAYPDAPPVLHDINLSIPAGTSLAIVGPTGSGKSTLVSLIPRLHDASPGTVLIDGQPIRNFTLSTLRKSIVFVPQETYLLSDT